MPFFTAFFLLVFSTVALGQPLQESPFQVWNVGGRQWTEEDELNFGRWVETHVTEDFFIRHNIPVDCADVPYAVRWIYARIARLPAAATTKDQKLIGHWSTQWKHLSTHPEWHRDLRFRAALLHILSETTTRTLPLDTYPVRIDQTSVTPGTPFFITESHAGIIGRVILDGSAAHPLQTWEATVPAKLQKVSQKNFLSPRPESTVYSGLVKFRWPVLQNGHWKYLPAGDHPFYSLEQYSSGFYEGYGDFVEAVARRIDPIDHDPSERVEKLLDNITTFVRARIPIVIEGYDQCRRANCSEGSPLWEIYSTPGRDGMITLLMDHLRHVVESNDLDGPELKEKMEWIRFPVAKGLMVDFLHLYQNTPWLSPHPEDPIEARWGLQKCEMILSQTRNALNAITFAEKTYRKRDPKYADFSVFQQEEILRRLQTEWNKSECKLPSVASAGKKTEK
jgi:hypothetical protein